MLVIFTNANCARCEALKGALDNQGREYVEFAGDRLGKTGIRAVDVESEAEYAVQGTLPIMVEVNDPVLAEMIRRYDLLTGEMRVAKGGALHAKAEGRNPKDHLDMMMRAARERAKVFDGMQKGGAGG